MRFDMKVLSISLGRRGGFPIYGFEMTRALSRIAKVGVVVARGSENLADWRTLSCKTLEVETYHDNKSALVSFFNLKRFYDIKKFIASIGPDVVYYPGGHYWKPVLDRCIPHTTPVVMTVHDPLPHPGEESAVNRFFSRIETRKPDGYILLNETQKNDFIARNKLREDSVTVIPHGIFSSYRAALRELEDIEEFAELLPYRRKYFLFIGRIVKYKGIGTLLKAVRSISPERNIPLVIAGGGSLSDEEGRILSELPKESTFFYNRWLDESEMATLTSNALMTMLPYEGATQSGVIPLSFALGTPAIASDSGGLREQMVDGKTGYVFETGNVTQLAEKILEARELTDERYEGMRLDCLEYADKHWDWNVLAENLLRFLNDVVRMRRLSSQ